MPAVILSVIMLFISISYYEPRDRDGQRLRGF